MMQVYLAGPITGADPLAPDWRDEAQLILERGNVRVVRPRAMSRYLDEYKLPATHVGMVLTLRDHTMTTGSDVVLANFENSTTGSIGTAVELGWASEAGVPIVGVVPPGNVHEHPMVLSVLACRVHTMKEGVEVVLALKGERL